MKRTVFALVSALLVFAPIAASADGGVDASADAGVDDTCALMDTCGGKSIGASCTFGETAGFCAPTLTNECDASTILCQPPLASADAGASACVSDESCAMKDASDSCGDAGACAATSCSNGGTMLTCVAITYGCENKQPNAPCASGPGTEGFCVDNVLGDGSVDELICDTDVADDSGDCRAGDGRRSGGGTSATIAACGIVLGLAVVRRRQRKRA